MKTPSLSNTPRDNRSLPLSHRRSLYWNYRGRGIYLFTLNIEGRKPLLGSLSGSAPEEASVQPSPLGKEVVRMLWNLPEYHRLKVAEKTQKSGVECKRDIQILAYQLMPDHLHIILFVKQPMDIPVGTILRGFMTASTKVCSTLGIHAETTPKQPLWEKGYNDQRLLSKDQLSAMIAYVHDNPRRLFVKRAYPEWFAIHRRVLIAGKEFDAVGNMQLLNNPLKAVHVRSRFTPEQRRDYMNLCILEARNGKLLVGAFISEYEQQIRKEAIKEKLPFIHLSALPFSDYYKPGGELFDVCAAGRLLVLHPLYLDSQKSVEPSAYMPREKQNPYWKTQRRITRAECVALNTLAEILAPE